MWNELWDSRGCLCPSSVAYQVKIIAPIPTPCACIHPSSSPITPPPSATWHLLWSHTLFLDPLNMDKLFPSLATYTLMSMVAVLRKVEKTMTILNIGLHLNNRLRVKHIRLTLGQIRKFTTNLNVKQQNYCIGISFVFILFNHNNETTL